MARAGPFGRRGQQAVEASIRRGCVEARSDLTPRKSDISGLPKTPLGAISAAIRATIDEIAAVGAGRQAVLTAFHTNVCGHWRKARSRFLKSIRSFQAPDI